MTDMEGNIKGRWKEFQGIEDNWAALLKAPELDNDFRRSILVYGNMAAAAGDSLAPKTVYPRGCLFDKKSFMSGVGLVYGNSYEYEVTKYIYTTAPDWSGELSSRYGGYVAVATDKGTDVLGRRDIVVALSGTLTDTEWHLDLEFASPTDPAQILGIDVGGKVHRGFLKVYTTPNKGSPFEEKSSARNQILEEVKRLVELYQDDPADISITLTGHSMGAAVATLCSIDIVGNKCNQPFNKPEKQVPVTVITFAGPKVGDYDFAKSYDGARGGGILNLLRVTGEGDPVPDLPLEYTHSGVKAAINATNSKHLNPIYLQPDKESKVHDLEVYCHGVAGSHNQGGFSLAVHRQVELVNKHLDIVIDPPNVPKIWWEQDPKGMVQLENGIWVPR